MQRPTILVVEDDPDIIEVLEYNLTREGFSVAVQRSGEDALTHIRRQVPSLVLLDLMLPGIDGLEVCRKLRASPPTHSLPIVILTAKGEESDIVLGLGLGADDYVAKPFSPRELVARIRAALRRAGESEAAERTERLERDRLSIDPDQHLVQLDGKLLLLTATELRLLHCLAAHPGRVFSRQELLRRAIGANAVVSLRNIDVHIRSVRRKLRDARTLIETVRGVGYRFRDGDP